MPEREIRNTGREQPRADHQQRAESEAAGDHYPDLVIFDCDGVLVDSEPLANRVLQQMLQEIGLHLTMPQIFDIFVGRSIPYCLGVIEDMLGRPPPQHFSSELQARMFEAFRAGLKATPGIEFALDNIRAPVCVASSGDHEKMRLTLGLTGLAPRFNGAVFSVTQVAHGKPAPHIYLYAAAQFGVDPASCVVVEDTPPGVRAGVAAGMTVFGYCAWTPVEKLVAAGAHEIFTDMHLLPELLRRHSRAGESQQA